jgi:hypothetical protein
MGWSYGSLDAPLVLGVLVNVRTDQQYSIDHIPIDRQSPCIALQLHSAAHSHFDAHTKSGVPFSSLLSCLGNTTCFTNIRKKVWHCLENPGGLEDIYLV